MSYFLNCRESVDLLHDYVEGGLDVDDHKKLDEHLSACPPCLHFLKTYRSCSEIVQQLREQKVQIPMELQNRLKSFLKDRIGKANLP